MVCRTELPLTLVLRLVRRRAAPPQWRRGRARPVGRLQLHLRLCGHHRLVQRVVVLRDRQGRLLGLLEGAKTNLPMLVRAKYDSLPSCVTG